MPDSLHLAVDIKIGRCRVESELQDRLVQIVRETHWLCRALNAARSLELSEWCIGAGALRNTVWDALQGGRSAALPADIDLAYFDREDLSQDRDHELQRRLEVLEPNLPWEVTNQAGVHLWFEQAFGHRVEPLQSLKEAVASWPETATSVAVTLTGNDEVRVIAPLGLSDLFGMIVRRNPRRVSVETYRQRIASKRYRERWPRVRVIPA